ncbi:hypothetical protein MHT86_01655 [Corynebacterium mastitidis]|uniref:Uncharacterized protein n=1 Tax=Corynebacterium mastitidis TaxID=161890 RepID=A0A2N0X6Z7_9CORY|nr:hypothetical protein [Corynebacterium mastitidis]MCH6196207.1 hypothetical protein [Corynebacterium mastitidis]PKF68467.1 hypothetical protein CXB45_07050 [Corynebacterium mastitidis]
MKRTFAAATLTLSLTAGAVAPASAGEFMDEERTVFDDPKCPSTADGDNDFLGKKQSIFDQCATQTKKPKKEKKDKSSTSPATPAEPSAPSEPSEPTTDAAEPATPADPTAPADPAEAAQPEKPAKKSPLSDADKQKLKETIQGSAEGYKMVKPLIRGAMKLIHIVRKIFIPFP